MTTARAALKRDRARYAAEQLEAGVDVRAGAYRSRHPLRLVRVGDRVDVRAGEVLTVVDAAGAALGHVQAGQSGAFVLTADAAAALTAKVESTS